MRFNFMRGIITGSILGAAISMMSGSKRRFNTISLSGRRNPRSKTRRMLKGVSRTVNDLIR